MKRFLNKEVWVKVTRAEWEDFAPRLEKLGIVFANGDYPTDNNPTFEGDECGVIQLWSPMPFLTKHLVTYDCPDELAKEEPDAVVLAYSDLDLTGYEKCAPASGLTDQERFDTGRAFIEVPVSRWGDFKAWAKAKGYMWSGSEDIATFDPPELKEGDVVYVANHYCGRRGLGIAAKNDRDPDSSTPNFPLDKFLTATA